MKRIWVLAAALFACAAPLAQAEVVIATPAQGAAIIQQDDEFVAALTPADLSIRLRREGGTADDLQALYAAEILPWTDAERARLEAMLVRVGPGVTSVQRWLPQDVLLVKNSDRIDGGLPHTRVNAIFFGPDLPEGDAALDEIFFHELFHVLSRQAARTDAAQQDALYGIIGFERCMSLDLPAEVRARMFTNPDAPDVNHVLQAQGQPADIYLTPLLTADPAHYDPSITRLFDYFELDFIKVRRDAATGRCSAVIENGALADFGDQGVPLLFARAGANTDYVLHPEEMMADNFAQLMMGRTDAPNPEVQQRLATLLGIAPTR